MSARRDEDRPPGGDPPSGGKRPPGGKRSSGGNRPPAYGDGRKVRLRLSELRRTPRRDWALRFAFGAGVSALAGVVSVLAGPRAGGLFLAFPAILLASVTLVAKEEGDRQAGQDVGGATFGALGLIGFAVVVAFTATVWPLWLSLALATLTWAALSLALYAALTRLCR
ncbi:DUF3147 family protein [Microbispora sp. NPDC088329]|uniref:DUF3147 family protein n=1 Tax=Microbispora sp. NPDC088329 TaxID=3154869 RepID=UPI003423A411